MRFRPVVPISTWQLLLIFLNSSTEADDKLAANIWLVQDLVRNVFYYIVSLIYPDS